MRAAKVDGTQREVVEPITFLRSGRGRVAVLECRVCLKRFTLKASALKYGYGKYCSPVCMASAYAELMKGDANPNFSNAGVKTCIKCGKEFKNYSKTSKMCSRECAGTAAKPKIEKTISEKKIKPLLKRTGHIKRQAVCKNCGQNVKSTNDTIFCRLCKRQWFSKKRKIYRCSICGVEAGKDRKYCDPCWEKIPKLSRGTPRRLDANHTEIVDGLRFAGCEVLDLSSVGGGVPDIFVWANNQWHAIEIKTAKGKLNENQKRFISSACAPVHVVRSLLEAQLVIGVKQIKSEA